MDEFPCARVNNGRYKHAALANTLLAKRRVSVYGLRARIYHDSSTFCRERHNRGAACEEML